MDQPREGVATARHKPERLGDDVVIHHHVRDAVGEIRPVLELLFRRRRIDDLVPFPLLGDPLEGLLGLLVWRLFPVQDRARKGRIPLR